MFTGIVQAIGKVLKYDQPRLWVRVPFRRIQRGESICIEGVCLTVADHQGQAVGFDVGPVTRRITSLGRLKPGAPVNLERALRYGSRMGGHWVTGHVEHTGRLVKIEPERKHVWISVQLPRPVRPFVIDKGSLSVDGISLTVVSVRRHIAKFMIIPHTWTHTTLFSKKAGDPVNLEADILAKYARGRLKRLPR